MSRIMIACGGTGGHLTPGISLAQSLEECGFTSWLLISRKSVDSRLAQKYPNLGFVAAPGTALVRSPMGVLRFLKELFLSYRMALKFIRKNEIDAVVAFGGFTSLGPAMAARWQGIPIFSHEANRAVGKAVRLISRYCRRVYLPEGMLLGGVQNQIVRNLGYPLRLEFRRVPKERARKILGVSHKAKLLVVLGGSQGAQSLNQWVKGNLENLSADGISTYCITGMQNESSGRVELLDESGNSIVSRFVSFSDEMNVVISAADVIVSRAGAGSLAEIVRCRVPSVMVPYPYAADDHQRLNARFLESKGGGVVCEDDVIENELIGEVREMMFNEELRSMIRQNLFAIDPGDVASKMVEDIRQVLSNEKGRETKRMRFWKAFA